MCRGGGGGKVDRSGCEQHRRLSHAQILFRCLKNEPRRGFFKARWWGCCHGVNAPGPSAASRGTPVPRRPVVLQFIEHVRLRHVTPKIAAGGCEGERGGRCRFLITGHLRPPLKRYRAGPYLLDAGRTCLISPVFSNHERAAARRLRLQPPPGMVSCIALATTKSRPQW